MADFLSTLFSGGAKKEAANKDLAALSQYGTGAGTSLQQGYNTGAGAISNAIGYYQPLANLAGTYNQAAPMLTKALGLGGQAGSAKALQAFQGANPQFGYGLNLAQQAAERAAAAGGGAGLGSGNLIMSEQQNATNLMNQAYQNWVNNLQQTGQMGAQIGLGAAGGM